MNQKLRKLYEQDQQDREKLSDRPNEKECDRLGKRDALRRKEALRLINLEGLHDGWDYYHVAMLWHHGTNTKHYNLAHTYANKALKLGNHQAEWLTKASYDRWQLSIGKPQKYATQFKIHQGKKVLVEPKNRVIDLK